MYFAILKFAMHLWDLAQSPALVQHQSYHSTRSTGRTFRPCILPLTLPPPAPHTSSTLHEHKPALMWLPPFPPAQDPHYRDSPPTLRRGCPPLSPTFYFSSLVGPRFIWLFNQNVIFTMLVCESWLVGGVGRGVFLWALLELCLLSSGLWRQPELQQ